jgi:hypothetical protein
METSGQAGGGRELHQPAGAALAEEGARQVRVPRLIRLDKDVVGGSRL